MKKFIFVILLGIFTLSGFFGYDVKKDFPSYSPDYAIRATNESHYDIDSKGKKQFYHTVQIIDYEAKIIYKWDCSDEATTLKKYRELITDYTDSYDIERKLLPELKGQISDYSTSNDGKWMICTIDENLEMEYLDISDEDFENLVLDRLIEGRVSKHLVVLGMMNVFDSFLDLYDYIYGSEEESPIWSAKNVIYILNNYIKTDENADEIEKIISEIQKFVPEEVID